MQRSYLSTFALSLMILAPACGGSGDSQECSDGSECESGVCDTTTGECAAATCSDGIQNADETGVDCGGSCDACVSCDDGVLNGDETGIDCGGTCDACPPTCDDGETNGDETDVDCGGGTCDPCANQDACLVNSDGESGVCHPDDDICVAPSCLNGFIDTNETDVDCGGVDCGPCDLTETCLRGRDCTSAYCDAGSCAYAQTCLDLLTGEPDFDDGTYTVDVDGSGGLAAMDVTCDMTTHGGGWMLILNYLHQGGTGPALVVRTEDLPLLNSTNLGDDGSLDAASWGHAGNELASAIPFDQTLWYARSGGHPRTIHFVNTSANVTSYVKTGTGSASPDIFDPQYSTRLNAGMDNAETLPLFTDGGNAGRQNEGDYALVSAPFYSDPDPDLANPTAYWTLGDEGILWAVDDTSSEEDTHHQVWVRPDPCTDGVANLDEGDVDCGGSSCAKCVQNDSCHSGADCESGVCTAGSCAAPVASCMEIRLADTSATDGLYVVNPGAGMVDVYCDMTTDGGGWMLLAQFSQHQKISDYPQEDYDAYFRTASWIEGASEGLPATSFPSYDDYHVRSHDWTDFLAQGEPYQLRQTVFRGYGAYTFDVSYDFDYNGYVVQDSAPDASRAWELSNRDVLRDESGVHWHTPDDSTLFWLPYTDSYTGSVFSGCNSYQHAASGCNAADAASRRHGNAGIIGTATDLLDPAGAWAPHMNTNADYDLVYLHQANSIFGLTGSRMSLLYWVRENSCANGQQDSLESGVDCGGSSACGGCAATTACMADTDCASGVCSGGTCAALLSSCYDILVASPDTPDGSYTVDPDASTPTEVYCDMTRNGGGWTLVAKVQAGNWTAFPDQAYIDIVANPIQAINPDLLLDTNQGDMAYFDRATTNKLFHASGGVVRVEMQGNTVTAANGTYLQRRISPPTDFDFWHAMRDSRLWGDGEAGNGVAGYGTTFIFDTIDSYVEGTNTFTHGGDSHFGWWSQDTLTLADASSLVVSRHGGLLCDGINNQGWLWMLTLDRYDPANRWKNDATGQYSEVWVK